MIKPSAVLIGPPGAGKTTVGRRLAARLEVAFCDTDTELERAVGMSVPDILERTGEAHFRVLERKAVQRALHPPQRCVVALGGGSVLDESVQRMLRRQPVVLLSVGLEQLLERIGDAADRPLLADDPLGRLRTALDVRTPIYRRLARHIVPVAPGEQPDSIAARIAEVVAPATAASAGPGKESS